MGSPATDPDLIAGALITVLSPGGTPVGGIGALVKRTPDVPYSGALPVVEVKPQQNVNTRIAASNSYQDRGWISLTYRDAPPTQSGATQSAIEDAFWTARNAIVTALRADVKLTGGSGGPAVSDAGAQIEEMFHPDGPFEVWQNAEYVVWHCRVSYIGPKQTVP